MGPANLEKQACPAELNTEQLLDKMNLHAQEMWRISRHASFEEVAEFALDLCTLGLGSIANIPYSFAIV